MQSFRVFIAAVIVILLALPLYFSSQNLVLTNRSTGEILFAQPVQDGIKFSIKFIHSVNQSPVAEIFEIRQNQITLVSLEFEDFGAGMPTELEQGQSLTHLPDGRLQIDGFDRTMSELRYMVGHAADLVLYIEQKRIPLNQLAEPGTLIEFEIRRLRPWDAIPTLAAF